MKTATLVSTKISILRFMWLPRSRVNKASNSQKSLSITSRPKRWLIGKSEGAPDSDEVEQSLFDGIDPDDMMCHTIDGIPVEPTEAFLSSLIAKIRRVVVDAPSERVDVGKARFFTGAARHAVKLKANHCIWPGCSVPSSAFSASSSMTGPLRVSSRSEWRRLYSQSEKELGHYQRGHSSILGETPNDRLTQTASRRCRPLLHDDGVGLHGIRDWPNELGFDEHVGVGEDIDEVVEVGAERRHSI